MGRWHRSRFVDSRVLYASEMADWMHQTHVRAYQTIFRTADRTSKPESTGRPRHSPMLHFHMYLQHNIRTSYLLLERKVRIEQMRTPSNVIVHSVNMSANPHDSSKQAQSILHEKQSLKFVISDSPFSLRFPLRYTVSDPFHCWYHFPYPLAPP